MLVYSIYSSVLLMCGYLVYRLFMADQRQHGLNRAVLLSIYAASLILPVIMMALPPAPQPVPSNIIIGGVELGELQWEGHAVVPEQRFSNLFEDALHYVNIGYLVITGMMTLYLLFSLAMIRKTIRSGKRIDYGEFELVLLDSPKDGKWKTNHSAGNPFSWRRYIVMSRTDYDTHGEMVLNHEREHLRKRHWIDLILAQAVIALQWYNPAAWLMRKELRKVHEYQADNAVAESGENLEEYKRMLIEKAVGLRFHTLANSLNNSKLKNRITMFDKQNPSTLRRMSALLVVPALAAGLAVMQLPAVAAVIDRLSAKSDIAPQTVGKITEISSTGEISNLAASTASVTTAVVTSESMATAVKSEDNSKEVFTAVEEQAEFPGGMKALMNYLASTIHYPENAAKSNIEGRVVVKFIVGENGVVSGAEVIRSVDPELDAEAVRVVDSMPKWEPAKNNGKPVASYFTIPVSFKLESKTVESNTEASTKAEKTGHPSYLIDGKVYDTLPATLKSEDVKSMTVHKDPETCDKYGVNPENGLIIIETK